jgi:hypothetical protein
LVDKKLDELKTQISQLGHEVDNEEADEVKSRLIRLWHTSIKVGPIFQVGVSESFKLQGIMASIGR